MRERAPRRIAYLKRAGLVAVGTEVIVHTQHSLLYTGRVVAIKPTRQEENPAVVLQIRNADGTTCKVSIGGGTAVETLNSSEMNNVSAISPNESILREQIVIRSKYV